MTRVIASLVLFSVLVSCVFAQSICDKYAGAVHLTGAQLAGSLVDVTVTSVVADPITKGYFDGSLSPFQVTGAINYTSPTNVAALTALKNSLSVYFFNVLGCTDKSLGNYTGRSMLQAHAPLPIGPVQFDSFNRQILAVLSTYKVLPEDQVTILNLLNSLKPAICNQPGCFAVLPQPVTFCDKYSSALNKTEYDLIDYVVGAVLSNVTSNSSSLRKFFDGTIPGTTNYLAATNAPLLASLRAHLNQFFGMGGVLNCTAANYPKNGAKSLALSHIKLQIDVASFNLFNTVLLDVMGGASVSVGDRASVKTILQSTQSQIVTVNSTATTSSTSTSTTGTSSTSTSAATAVAVSVVAIVVICVSYLL